jgi:hypothetical protein
MRTFLQGYEHFTAIVPKIQLFSEQELDRRANEMAWMQHTYHLAHNNCEHLAWECLTGFRMCTQLEANQFKMTAATIGNLVRMLIFAR